MSEGKDPIPFFDVEDNCPTPRPTPLTTVNAGPKISRPFYDIGASQDDPQTETGPSPMPPPTAPSASERREFGAELPAAKELTLDRVSTVRRRPRSLVVRLNYKAANNF